MKNIFCKVCTREMFNGMQYIILKHTEEIICMRCIERNNLNLGAGTLKTMKGVKA